MFTHSHMIERYFNQRGSGAHLSLFRLLWAFVHIYICIKVLVFTLLHAHLPPAEYAFIPSFLQLPNSIIYILCGLYAAISYLYLFGMKLQLVQIALPIFATILFFQDASSYSNHIAFALVISWLMCNARTEKYFSLEAETKKKSLSEKEFSAWQHEDVSLFPQKLVLLQASFLYVFSAINKLEPTWFARWSFTEEALWFMRPEVSAVWKWMIEHAIAPAALGSVIALMLFLAIGIHFAARHKWIAICGVLLHFGFSALFQDRYLFLFAYIMLCVWFVSLSPKAKD